MRWTPLLWVGGGALIGLALVAGLVFLQPPRTHVYAGVVQPEAARVDGIALQTRGDVEVPLEDYRGRYLLISFGYTFCPDVCPTTLSMLSRLMTELGEQREHVGVAFVSIDPERDTPDRIAQYAAGFDPAFVGLSGSPAQIAAAARAFNVSYSRQEAANSAAGYLMNHSAFVYLVDPEGHWRITYPYGVEADAIAQDLRVLLDEDAKP